MDGARPDLSSYLPEIRRYARILTGSQKLGDWYVRITLQVIIKAIARWAQSGSSGDDMRFRLYHAFQQVWARATAPADLTNTTADDSEEPLGSHLRALPELDREALLLTELCGFSIEQASRILDVTIDQARDSLASALSGLQSQTATTVLIIEDEPIIALDLNQIVVGMGHRVIGLAETKTNAVVLGLAKRPGVILADIQLRDGSSGVDAVNDILAHFRAPVIFVTAFPERLMKGPRVAPTYLVTKPFDSEELKLTINKALLLHAPPAYAMNA